MATILRSGKRKCTSQCYNAKHAECHCICGGVNHQVGEARAMENADQLRQALETVGVVVREVNPVYKKLKLV